MSEIMWVLEQLDDVVENFATDYTTRSGDPVQVIRINRNESLVFDSGEELDMNEAIHKREDDLTRGIFVGARLASRSPSAVGTEYDHRLETVIGIRIEGLTHRQYGHVDPTGENGIPFDVLTRQIRRALLESRSYPNTGTPNTVYHDLLFANESSNSAEYRDFYQYDVDAALRGYEDLP